MNTPKVKWRNNEWDVIGVSANFIASIKDAIKKGTDVRTSLHIESPDGSEQYLVSINDVELLTEAKVITLTIL